LREDPRGKPCSTKLLNEEIVFSHDIIRFQVVRFQVVVRALPEVGKECIFKS
jgi:hypothetical protein